MRHLAALVLFAAFLLSASMAFGQEASVDFRLSVGESDDGDLTSDGEGEREGYSPDHPLSVGMRSGAWIQSQVEPGVGGFLRFRPFSWLAGEVSTDHYFALDGRRRDHLVDGVAAFVSAQAGLFVGENAQVLVTENEIAVSGSVFLEPVALLGAGASYAF